MHKQRIAVILAAAIGIGSIFFPWIYARNIFSIENFDNINLIKRGFFIPAGSAVLYAAYLPWKEIVPLGWANLTLFGIALMGAFLGNRRGPLRGIWLYLTGIPPLIASYTGIANIQHWRRIVREPNYLGKAPYVLVLASLFIVAVTLIPRNWATLFKRYLHATGRALDIDFLITELGQESQSVRQRATAKLVDIGTSALQPLCNALSYADKWRIRSQAAEVLGKIGDVEAIDPLVKALQDKDANVREQAALALIYLDWEPQNTQEQHQYSFALQDWDFFTSLGLPEGVEVLNAFVPKYPDIHTKIKEVIRTICGTVKIVAFGDFDEGILMRFDSQEVLSSPNTSTLPYSLPCLKRIIVHLPTYDFHQVERFLTYAVNSLGQVYLKKHVTVELYGDPELFHLNLLNSMKNLCKDVVTHKECGNTSER